jgi:hypothetical protein
MMVHILGRLYEETLKLDTVSFAPLLMFFAEKSSAVGAIGCHDSEGYTLRESALIGEYCVGLPYRKLDAGCSHVRETRKN